MADFPAMPLWTDAYLADTRHLSAMEHGAYLLLMMEAWRRPSCTLPDDDALLARLACMSHNEWGAARENVLAFWSLDEKTKTWRQKRLMKEHKYLQEKRSKNKRAAAKRWNSSEKDDANGYAEGMPKASQPTPTPTPPKKEPSVPKKEAAPRQELEAVLDPEHAAAVLEHRQRIRKPLTARAAKMLAGKFAQCPDPNAAADYMILQGWQGFEPEWMARQRGSPGGQRQSAFRDHQDAVRQNLERASSGRSSYDDGQPAFDLGSEDYRRD